ncbi:hypothetical protein SDC9_11401 [bioreactor metagenome]|uniref:Uncharacterized protein n=1 Tax=bioreactor metagenome TaxID=1076179 RepID=A0A644TH36_9ZZZZ
MNGPICSISYSDLLNRLLRCFLLALIMDPLTALTHKIDISQLFDDCQGDGVVDINLLC